MKLKYSYVCVLSRTPDDPDFSNTVSVLVPDLDGATYGRNRSHAIEMAKEVIRLRLMDFVDDNLPFPKPRTIEQLKNAKAEYLRFIDDNEHLEYVVVSE